MSFLIPGEHRHLLSALESYAMAYNRGDVWPAEALKTLRVAGINNLPSLSAGCRDLTIGLDMELFGVPSNKRFCKNTMHQLSTFLPGPVGFRCFRLAQLAAVKVENGMADTDYVHRAANDSAKNVNEVWKLSPNGEWILHVDCAGFVRSCLKHVTKDPFVMALSDRSFMRAKDFYNFFHAIPYTVLSRDPAIAEEDQTMKWRLVPDLRMVIPGDIICYRPRGRAAGGAAFTINDRSDLNHLFKAVKAAQLWHEKCKDDTWGGLTSVNMANDPSIKPWVKEMKTALAKVGITSVKQLFLNTNRVNELLKAGNLPPFDNDTLSLMMECCQTLVQNTGHIVFASGRAEDFGDDIFRVKVVHSTKYGKTINGEITQGVQEYFRRFKRKELPDGTSFWTRDMVKAKPLLEVAPDAAELDEDEIAESDDGDEADDGEDTTPGDDCAGAGEVDVIIARMCF